MQREAQQNLQPEVRRHEIAGNRAVDPQGLASPTNSLSTVRETLSSTSLTISETPAVTTENSAPPRDDAKASKASGDEARALAGRLLPDGITDRDGWASDIVDAIDALNLPANSQYLCATMAVIGQESGFQADPIVTGLPAIALAEIDRLRDKFHIPRVFVDKALDLRSPNGRSYRARIDAARTEKELSDAYEDFFRHLQLPILGNVSDPYNPIRTLGPMQVSIAFINEHSSRFKDKIPDGMHIRAFGFSRRGGVLFGTMHLLDYAAPYDLPIYRFADYNAGRYASRNAAFQNAIARLSNTTLSLDGILLTEESAGAYTGETLRAAQSLTTLLRLTADQIANALKLHRSVQLESTELYRRVFKLADERAEAPLPRALLPNIKLSGPKIQRKNLSTSWFAQRVDTRYRACLARDELATSE
ncbi:DUF1615 family protein [Propionivibrio dicarboxylicus]|nr:DUF1615 family protein [Propionivibrio dicarboxylicus]